jgi:hypothetical protein
LNDRIATDCTVEFEATEDVARRSIADAEDSLTKVREIVAEAVGPEGKADAGQSV